MHLSANLICRISLIASVAALSACTTLGMGEEPDLGLASNIDAASLAQFSPGALGEELMKDLPQSAQRAALLAELTALEKNPAGSEQKWTAGENYSGIVRPAQPYKVGSQTCRQFSQEIMGPNIVEARKGTACRDLTGRWKVVK